MKKKELASSSPLQRAKMAYAALLREALSLGARELTAQDVADYAKGFELETVSNYLKGKTAPPSREKHADFIDAIDGTLKLKGSKRRDELPILRSRLDAAYGKLASSRRRKESKPADELRSTTNGEAIRRVLAASAPTIEAFLDSADFYGIATRAYFNEVGAVDPGWEGPLTYHALQTGIDPTEPSSLRAPPKRKNSPIHLGQPDSFDAVKKTLTRFAEEFAAIPKLRDGLLAALFACNNLELELGSYWDLNRPCAEHPFFDMNERQAASRNSVTTAFRNLTALALSRDPEYVAQLRELALRADASAAEVERLARTAADEMEREAIRRGIAPPASSSD